MAHTIGEWLEAPVSSGYADAYAERITDVDLHSTINNEDLRDVVSSRLANRERLPKVIVDLQAESDGEPRYDGPGMTSPKTVAQSTERRPDVPPSSLP